MKNIVFLLGILSLVVTQSACRSMPPQDTVTVGLFNQQNQSVNSEVLQQLNNGALLQQGIIISAQPGDIIDVEFSLNSDLLELDKGQHLQLRAKRPLWVYAHDNGVSVSLDGKDFQAVDKLFGGELTASFNMQKTSLQNQLEIKLITYTK